MYYNFCTITTQNHIPYVLTLNQSIRKFSASHLFVLVLDSDEDDNSLSVDGISFLYLSELNGLDGVNRYLLNGNIDEFRWSLKPFWMKFLFNNYQIEELIYVDNDIMFFNDYSFLFDEMKRHQVLLTPHWRNPYPSLDVKNFDLLYNHGIYNAGFIGVNKSASGFLDWFCEVVEYKMIRKDGFYDDQKFLDVVPIYFENVKILEHKGCNVSEWNESLITRQLKNRELYLNDYPLIFIHFVSYYKYILFNQNKDPFIKPFYDIWYNKLLENGLIEKVDTTVEPKKLGNAIKLYFFNTRKRILKKFK
jgi:hypothetical protein